MLINTIQKEGAVLGLPPILLLSAQSRRDQILSLGNQKQKAPMNPPEPFADRESPVRQRIIARRINMKKFLSKLERVPLREAWKHEANDFTPWLADLELVATEHVAALEFLNQNTSIEQALGFELDWQELPDTHACRIAAWRQDSPIEDEAQWAAYLDWFVQRIVKMNTVFKPVIQALA